MPTRQERENLMADSAPKHSGFTPRPIQRLATKKKPHMMIDIECNHFLRANTEEATHGLPPLSYRLWQETGKFDAPIPDKPDTQYNSNVWQNFRRQFCFHVNSEGKKISEMIASMYPLNIPAPSRVGNYTFEKFLCEIDLIKDEKLRKIAIARAFEERHEFRRLRLNADSRNPPMDTEGAILPPKAFKKYVPRFLSPGEESIPPSSLKPSGPTQVDIFGRNVPKARTEPYLWKLTYKLNHPEYRKLREEVNQRRTMSQNPQLSSLTFENVK